jgi:predicted kinase
MNTIILVRGLPGSGKSSFAAMLGAAVLEADQYFQQDGTYKFNPQKLRCAHKWCQEEAEKYMQANVPKFFVCNTFTQNWELQPYVELARKYAYRVVVLTIESGLDSDALAGRNLHSVPPDAIQRMANRWEDYANGV